MTQYIGSGDENYGELEDFCDAVLKTDDGYSFKVHRVILAKNSIYFRKMFLFGERDQPNAEFTLSRFSGRTIKKILQYLYHGKIILVFDNIFELLLASDYFLLDDLFLKYRTFLKENLSVTNCLKVFIASHINNRLVDLYKSSRMLILINFSKLLDQPTNDLPEIPFHLFKVLLEDDSLNIPDETYVWRAVEQWVGNSYERLPAVGELLSTIRFRNLNSHLVQYFQKSNILRKNPYLKELNSLLLFGELPDLRLVFKNVLSSMYPKTDLTKPRQPKRLFLIAKHDYKERDQLYVYHKEVCMRRKITFQAEINFSPGKMEVVDNLAYMFDSRTGHVITFNFLDKTWNEMQTMNRLDIVHIIGHMGQFIYVLGDEFSTTYVYLYKFQRYDTKSQTWKHLGSTTESNTAALIGNKIYILNKNPLSKDIKFEEYDTISGTFSDIPLPESFRFGLEMAAYDNQLFVIQLLESDDDGPFNSVEVFNPEARVWKKIPSLPYGLADPDAKVVDDKLIVFDCFRKDPNCPPVFWNKKENVWEPIRSNISDIWNYSVCLIEDVDSITCLMNEKFNYEEKWEFSEDDIFNTFLCD